MQRAVGQLHDDQELSVDDVETLQRQDKRMVDGLDAAEGFQFLLGAAAIAIARCLQVAVDELDGLEQTPRRLSFPDLAETSPTQTFDQSLSGYRFVLRSNLQRHAILGTAWGTKKR